MLAYAHTRGTFLSQFYSGKEPSKALPFLLGLTLVPNIVLLIPGRGLSIGEMDFVFFDHDRFASARLHWAGWLISGVFLGFGARFIGDCPLNILTNAPVHNFKNGGIAFLVIYLSAGLIATLRL